MVPFKGERDSREGGDDGVGEKHVLFVESQGKWNSEPMTVDILMAGEGLKDTNNCLIR